MVDETQQLSGYELNRAVAEKFGYSIYHYSSGGEASAYYTLQDEDGGNVIDYGKPSRANEKKTEAEAWRDAPDWSDDMDLAMGLVDKRGFTLGYSPSRVMWFASFVISLDDATEVTADGSTAPEAICRAFLLLDLEAEKQLKRLLALEKQKAQIEREIEELTNARKEAKR